MSTVFITILLCVVMLFIIFGPGPLPRMAGDVIWWIKKLRKRMRERAAEDAAQKATDAKTGVARAVEKDKTPE